MNFVAKSWWWKLTGPFAGSNYTTIWDTIYCPEIDWAPSYIVDHEQYHMYQQMDFAKKFKWLGEKWSKRVGLSVWIFCYLFLLPIWFNPLRKKSEIEAYTMGSGYTEEYAKRILRGTAYGWLL